MGDGFKIWIVCQATILHLKNTLDLRFTGSTKTGEIYEYPLEAEEDDLKFRLFLYKGKELIEVRGNFYKIVYCKCNYGDFHFLDLHQAIKILVEKYKVNPFNTRVINLEVGVNLHLPHSPKLFLDNIVCYKGKATERKGYNNTGDFFKFEFTEYALKIYDKGLHCQLKDENILRIELKGLRYRFLKQFGIETLHDLLYPGNLLRMNNYFLKLLDYLILYDRSLDLKELKVTEREFLLKYKDPSEWANLLQLEKEGHRKARVRFNKLIEKYTNRNLTNEIKVLISNKAEELLKLEDEEYEIVERDRNRWAIGHNNSVFLAIV